MSPQVRNLEARGLRSRTLCPPRRTLTHMISDDPRDKTLIHFDYPVL